MWTAADEKQLDALRTKVYDLLEVARDEDADQTLLQALDGLVGGRVTADARRLVNFLLSSEMETEYGGGAG